MAAARRYMEASTAPKAFKEQCMSVDSYGKGTKGNPFFDPNDELYLQYQKECEEKLPSSQSNPKS
jgi:hypothetical protein